MLYLYVFEDGTIKQDTQQPTECDLQTMADGLLAIYRINFRTKKIEECCGYTDDGAFWGEVEQAEVASTHGVEWHE